MGPFLEGVKRPQGKGLEKLQQEYDYKVCTSRLLLLSPGLLPLALGTIV